MKKLMLLTVLLAGMVLVQGCDDFDGIAANHLAEDAIAQYNIAREAALDDVPGALVDMYAYADQAATFYLLAKDDLSYRKWKRIAAQAEKQYMAEQMKQF